MKTKGKNGFIEEAIDKHEDKYLYHKVIYINNKTKVKIYCNNCKKFFRQTPAKHLLGHGCLKCSLKNRTFTRSKFISESKLVHGKKFRYHLVKYINALTKVWIMCPKHGKFLQTPASHMNGVGCEKCSKSHIHTINIRERHFIIKADIIHNNKYDYSLVKYYNNFEKVDIICPEHGVFSQRPVYHTSGNGCPKCSESWGEKKVSKVLTINNLNSVREYKFPESRYRYDFYLSELNILIEYDGIQHYKSRERFGGDEAFKQTKLNDKAKNELAILYDTPLIRIPYTEYDDLEDYLLWKLSKIYKYRVGDKFYKNLGDICTGLQLPGTTTRLPVVIPVVSFTKIDVEPALAVSVVVV